MGVSINGKWLDWFKGNFTGNHRCCALACMSCSCRLITSRSVTLARASTRMRRLLMQQQAVRCNLARWERLQGVLFVAIRHECLPVFWGCTSVCKHSLGKGVDPVPHCDSGVLEAGMPIHWVALYLYGQAAFEQWRYWLVLEPMGVTDWEPCKEGRHSASKIDPCVRSWMRLIGDNYFDWATWSTVSIDSCTFRGCSNQLWQYRPKPVCGVQQAFCFGGGQCL